MTDFKSLAEQLVADWPRLTSEQQAVVGSVMRRDR